MNNCLRKFVNSIWVFNIQVFLLLLSIHYYYVLSQIYSFSKLYLLRRHFNLLEIPVPPKNQIEEKVVHHETAMRPILNEFCCLVPLRSGCIIIGCFLLVTATMFLFGYFNHNNPNKDKRDEFFLHEGIIISFIGCVFNYVIGVLLLTGVCMRFPWVVLASAVVLLLYTVFCLGAAVFAAVQHKFVPCVSLLMYAALEFYFSVASYSSFAEIKEEEQFWTSVEESYRERIVRERQDAREQGLPDPMKAILKKYRQSLREDSVDRREQPIVGSTMDGPHGSNNPQS